MARVAGRDFGLREAILAIGVVPLTVIGVQEATSARVAAQRRGEPVIVEDTAIELARPQGRLGRSLARGRRRRSGHR